MQIDLSEADVKNVLYAIRMLWESGNVRGEPQGATLAELRTKFEAALKPAPPKEPEKK